MTTTVLVRIRFPVAVLRNVDHAAHEVAARLSRKISRAAVIRAAIYLLGDKPLVDDPGLAELFARDTVRRGRAAGPRKARRT